MPFPDDRPFELDLNRLQELQASMLFSNLTVRPLIHDNKVTLEVSAAEHPSIHISPEVTLSASIERPEVSGGVSPFDFSMNESQFKLKH